MKGMFNTVLSYLGLYNKKRNIVLLGLENAGKTTLLHIINDDPVIHKKPRIYSPSDELRLKNLNLNAYELEENVNERIWKDNFPELHGILFLIDSADVNKFPEAKKELEKILNTPELDNIPIAILGNKIDIKDSVSYDQLKEALDYDTILAKETRPIEIFMVCVTKKIGVLFSLEWICKNFKI